MVTLAEETMSRYKPAGRREPTSRKRMGSVAGERLPLARSCREGAAITDQATVREGLSANLARLWRYGVVLCRDRDVAEDLVQQTCLRALERASQFRPGTRLDHWLMTILHSIWINEMRARKVREGTGQLSALEALVVDGAGDMDLRLAARDLMKTVDVMPENQRLTVYLAYVEGFSYREVADMLDIPIGTVMSRLAAARARLAGLGDMP